MSTTSGIVRVLALAALVALAGGCATRETVVLLPERDGRDTAVTVTREGKEAVTLDKPYAAAQQSRFGQTSIYTSNADDVAATFGPALGAQPARAATFTLYFVEGRDELTDESKAVVDGILTEIARRPVPDVLVIGHTDTMGSDQVNDALALRRANFVRDQLIARGMKPADVQASGRGKRELAVPTADNVAEPRNRRVVIVVR